MAKQKKGSSVRTRNARRQATPPPTIPTKPPEEQLSGISRVNKEIASLIARKDPVLNRVVKKPKVRIPRQKKGRMEVKMIKAAAKADQLVEKTSKAHQRGKEIKKRKADWDVINDKKPSAEKPSNEIEEMKVD